MRRLCGVFALWVAPLVVAPPLFSRDVYSLRRRRRARLPRRRSLHPRAGVGAGIDVLPAGRPPVAATPMRRTGPSSSTSPGRTPTCRALSSPRRRAIGCVALVGVVLIAVSVPALARSFGRDPSAAFALAVLNPLVLLYSRRGDAQRRHHARPPRGAAVALARRGHPVLGIVLCALGAEVKVPVSPRGRLHRLGLGRRAGVGAPARRLRRRRPWSSPWP